MTGYIWIILALWLLFVAVWVISAASAKRNVNARGMGTRTGVRLVMLVIVVLVIRVPALRDPMRNVQMAVYQSDVVRVIGVVLCALGVGLAIVARMNIGRNWGMPMSQKENPELVTTGPYKYIRHPIYTAMLLAMLGSALAATVVWFVPFVILGGYFVYSATREEKLMLAQFPEQYAAYRRRTKMLVPFVF
jgi:protein-S-isoprenylcysteine O-methyltransferase Ste14